MTNQLEALIAEMKAAAEKATQGNWRRASTLFNGITVTPLSLGVDEKMMGNFSEKRDSIFVTKCQPDNILALVAALEQSQQTVVHLGEQHDEWERKAIGNFEACSEMSARVEELESQRKMAFMTSNRWADKFRVAEKRIAELEASKLAVKLPDEFLTIGENLRTQDNRITSFPMFCVYQKEEIVVDAEYNHDRIVWWHSDGYEASANQTRRLELLNDGLRDTGEWKRLAVKEINDFVTCCFTEQGCKDYLDINGHNLRKPFIYVKSGFRNNEYQAIRNWLMSAGGTVQGDE